MLCRILTISTLLLSSCSWNPTEPEPEKVKLTIEWAKEINIINAPTTMPLVIEEKQVVYTGEPELVSLKATTGEELWRAEIDGERDLESKSLMYDKNLERIVSNHFNSFYVWDGNDGRLLLSVNGEDGLKAFRHGRNSILDDGYALVGDTLDAYVLNKDGSIRFKIDVEFGTSGISYYGKKVYISQIKTIHGGLTLGKVRAFNSQSGDSLWSYYTENGGFDWAAPIIENGVVYAGAIGNSPVQEFVALDAETGEVIWRQTNNVWTFSFILGPEYVYVNTSGTLAALDKTNGSIIWRYEWSSGTSMQPVYLEGYVYHSDHGRIFVLDAETGQLVHEEPVPPGGSYFWHLAVSSDKLFAQTSRQLIAYQPWHLREE